VGLGFAEAVILIGSIVAILVFVAWVWDAGDRERRTEAIATAAAEHNADFSRQTRGMGRTMLAYDPDKRLVCAAGPKLPRAVVISADRITGIEVAAGRIDPGPPQRKSVVGRAAVGGLLFGGVGAVVGAASGLSGSRGNDGLDCFYLGVFTDHPDLPHHAVIFGSYQEAQEWGGRVLAVVGRGTTA
jgi:hypothetical protein